LQSKKDFIFHQRVRYKSFFYKDPRDYAYYKEGLPMTREQHQPSPLTAALNHVEETPSVEAGKKATC
jgi:hypothetical protein